jgi:F-type H+-transporting ATPase subunit delta
MPATTQYSPVALSYARALLDLGREQNAHERIGKDLAAVRQIIESEPQFGQFLRDPAISRDERRTVVDRILRPLVHPLVGNFLLVANEHGRLGFLDQIAAAYKALLDELLGNVEVELTVAHELTPDQLEMVRLRVSDALKKNARIKQNVDDSIIGGMVLKVEDTLIDASVKSQLRAMKKQLLARIPR